MSRRPPLAPSLPAFLAACLATTVLTGCRPAADVRPGDIRTYTVARAAPAASVTPADGAASGAPAPAPAAAARVRYETPDGWTERPAAGMRLATLAIGDPGDGHEVTVIPASGTLRGNVERWQGQLDPEGTEADRAAAVDRALAAAETVDVDGTPANVVALFDAAAAASPEAAGQAILGAMIPVGETSALFVKFKGDAAVARRERDNFVRFVSSLRWQ